LLPLFVFVGPRIKLCHHSLVLVIYRTQRESSVDVAESAKNLTIRSSVARIIRRGCYTFWYHEPGTQRRISQTGQSLRSSTSLAEVVEIPERLLCEN
ncbi:hypothetical protein T11_10767, partial [Trichinella zimbabwensis]